MKFDYYSHQGAGSKVPRKVHEDIENAIASSSVRIRRGQAKAIRESIVDQLAASGWPGEFPVAPPSKISIASVMEEVGLAIQTGGNMARIYADLLKLQKLFLENQLVAGAYILPSARAAKELGENVANADRLISELEIFRKVIHMPIAVFAFD